MPTESQINIYIYIFFKYPPPPNKAIMSLRCKGLLEVKEEKDPRRNMKQGINLYCCSKDRGGGIEPDNRRTYQHLLRFTRKDKKN